MSMPIVRHVFDKSQARGSARCLLMVLAVHSNDCCGVAWVSDTTLHREANISRQRCHEIKNALKDAGELVLVERPGYTNLYFIAQNGKPLGGQGDFRAAPGSTHTAGCPLRRGLPGKSERVSDVPDTYLSEISDTPCQETLTQKTNEKEKENEPRPAPEPPRSPGSLPDDQLQKLGLSPGSRAWEVLTNPGQLPLDRLDVPQQGMHHAHDIVMSGPRLATSTEPRHKPQQRLHLSDGVSNLINGVNGSRGHTIPNRVIILFTSVRT